MIAGIKSHLRYAPGCVLSVVKSTYLNNGRIALELVDAETGEPMAKATMNIPEAKLAADEVLIKDYSENAGMVKTLIEGGVIEPTPLQSFNTGFVVVDSYKLCEGWVG